MKKVRNSKTAPRSITALSLLSMGLSIAYGQPASKNLFPVPGLTTPIGIAYSPVVNRLLITQPFCGGTNGTQATGFNVQAVDASGAATPFAALPNVPLSSNPAFGHSDSPSNQCFEFYPAVSPGLGGFTAGDVYVTQGQSVVKIPATGGSASTFATGLSATDTESGITFDNVGTFCNDLIVSGQNGGINLITSAGTVVNYATLAGDQLESIAVAPLSFGAFGGWLIIGNHTGGVLAVPPPATCPATVPASPVTAVNISNIFGGPADGSEGLAAVPPQAGSCQFGGGALFSVTYTGPVVIPKLVNPYQIVAYPAANFATLIGDIVVSAELGDTDVLSPSPSVTASTIDNRSLAPTYVQQEGLTFVSCPPPPGTGCPATQGFWHKAANWPAVNATVDGIVYNGGTDFSMVIGGIKYSQAQLLQLMPSGGLHSGNYANSLSQLIAAVLNIAAGAQHAAGVDAVIAEDNSALFGVQIFCGSGLCTVPAPVVTIVENNEPALDNYNSAVGLGCSEGAGLNTGSGK
jgi:hypothetical protein